MALTPQGLITPRQPEILQDIVDSERELIDPNINTDEDLLLGQQNTIYSTQVALAYELLQDVYDSRKLSVAEGVALDDLVSVLGISRQPATATAGVQYFTAKIGVTIVANSQVVSPVTGAVYTLDSTLNVSPSFCRQVRIGILPAEVADSTLYEVTVKGTTFQYTSGVSATALSILQGLNTEINNTLPSNVTSTLNTSETLLVISETTPADMAVAIDPTLYYEDITVAGNVTGTTKGAIVQAASTVTQIGSPVANWLSTNNPAQFITGRDIETDEELRARAQLATSGSGRATIDAIINTILNVTGVSYCDVIESTFTYPVSGQPVGSINTIVVGGSNADVAQALLDSKGAGVETFGAITQAAVDRNGKSRDVNFDRPTVVPNDGLGFYVNVTFDLFDDEVFPVPEADGIEAMRQAIINYGNSLGNGVDVDAGRFFGPIYSSVNGISNLVVEISDDGVTYTTGTIAITDAEVATFVDSGRIAVAKNP